MRIDLSFFKNVLTQLIIMIIAVHFFGHYLPLKVQQTFLAISWTLKQILLLVLPFIIFGCLLSTLLAQKKRALFFILGLFVLVTVSNFLSALVGYFGGWFGVSKGLIRMQPAIISVTALQPLWDWSAFIPSSTNNGWALLAGLLAGLLFSFYPNRLVTQAAHYLNQLIAFFLKKLFIPVLPLFALGFILKIQYEGLFAQVIQNYMPIFMLITITNILYLAIMYAFAANFRISLWLQYLKNALPTGIMGFSTMSSLATMPLTLAAAEKNTEQSDIVQAVIPATANNHLIGNSIATPIIAIAILLSFGKTLPNFYQFLPFAGMFVLYKFAVAGVPAGSVMVVLPLLEKYLGFSGEMSALLMPLYMLLDPLITGSNVLGNGAFVILFNKLYKLKQKT